VISHRDIFKKLVKKKNIFGLAHKKDQYTLIPNFEFEKEFSKT
jgi:hypothetical protein